MSQQAPESAEFDVEAVAALARPSNAPPPPSAKDAGAGESTLDLAAIRDSIRPEGEAPVEEPEEPVEAKPAVATKPKKAAKAADEVDPFAAATVAATTETEAKPSTPAPAPERAEKKGGNMWVGVAIGAAIAAAAMFFLRPAPSDEGTVARGEQAHETASAPRSTEETRPAAVSPRVEPEAPSVAETTPAETTPAETTPEATPVAEPSVDDSAPTPASAPSTTQSAGTSRARTASAGTAPSAMAEAAPTMEPESTMEAAMAADPIAAVTAGSMAPGTSAMASGSSAMGDSIDALLNSAIGGAPAPMAAAAMAEEPAAAMTELPETPSRSTTTRVLAGLMPRMRQCAGDQVGVAVARLRVSNDGSVGSANVSGRPFGGTPQGECMERALRGARFPRFTRPTFDVTYPFTIR